MIKNVVFMVSFSALAACSTTPADLRATGSVLNKNMPLPVAEALENMVKNGEPCAHSFDPSLQVVERYYQSSDTGQFAIQYYGGGTVALLNVDLQPAAAGGTALAIFYSDSPLIDNPPAKLFALDAAEWAAGHNVCSNDKYMAAKRLNREKAKAARADR